MKFMFQNKSGETYPAYGCGRLKSVLSTDSATGNPVFELVKPDGEDGIYVVNGPNNIIDNGEGVAISIQDAILVLIDDGSAATAPTFGEACGPEDGRWAATTAGTGLRASGESANRLMPVVTVPASGSGVLSVRFRIVAATAYCAECYATARVISGPPDANPDSLPGSTFDYEAQYYTIRVYDMGEGWLNYPPEELLNMIGHATWLRSYEDGPCSEVPSLHWEIIDMQDPEEEGWG